MHYVILLIAIFYAVQVHLKRERAQIAVQCEVLPSVLIRQIKCNYDELCPGE